MRFHIFLYELLLAILPSTTNTYARHTLMDRPNERAALTADDFLELIERHLCDALQRRDAAQKVAQAPEQAAGKPVLGVPLSGELPDWRAKTWVVYPSELLNRH